MLYNKSVDVFCCWSESDKDEKMYKALRGHLKTLEQDLVINVKDYSQITGGEVRDNKIEDYLRQANIILLIITRDFIADFTGKNLWEFEVKLAMKRHRDGRASVIPILLESCHWQCQSIKNLEPLPWNGQAVTSTSWENKQDEAFLNIVIGIETVVKKTLTILELQNKSRLDLQKLSFNLKTLNEKTFNNLILQIDALQKESAKTKRERDHLKNEVDYKTSIVTALEDKLKNKEQESLKYRRWLKYLMVAVVLLPWVIIVTPGVLFPHLREGISPQSSKPVTQHPTPPVTPPALGDGSKKAEEPPQAVSPEVSATTVLPSKGQDVINRRNKLGLNKNFFNQLVNEVFCPQHPELSTGKNGDCNIEEKAEPQRKRALNDEWSIVAMQIIEKLETLSPNARQGMTTDRGSKNFRAQLSGELLKLHLSQKSLEDLTDARFCYLFANLLAKANKECILTRKSDFATVWYAIAEDRLRQLQDPSEGILTNIKPAPPEPKKNNEPEPLPTVTNFDEVFSGRLKPGQGKVYIAYFEEGVELNVELKTDSDSLKMSIYDPKSTTLLRRSLEKDWQEKLKISGYYEIVIVSSDIEKEVSYELVVEAEMEPIYLDDSPQTPEEAVKEYFLNLKNGDYDKAWERLSDKARKHKNSGAKFSLYQKFWRDTVKEFEVLEIRSIDQGNDMIETTVIVEWYFIRKSDGQRIPQNDTWALQRNHSDKNWIIVDLELEPKDKDNK
ncbi:MAG: hypothetical protein F6J93_25285 [Oscillatoria sp. SIO1A7]|nr:hypothetical protein [Oscillatoria sp. SIO1A7]